MSFSDLLDRFDKESATFDLKQKVERLQFEYDFWTNAESGAKSSVERASYHRRAEMVKQSLHNARSHYQDVLIEQDNG